MVNRRSACSACEVGRVARLQYVHSAQNRAPEESLEQKTERVELWGRAFGGGFHSSIQATRNDAEVGARSCGTLIKLSSMMARLTVFLCDVKVAKPQILQKKKMGWAFFVEGGTRGTTCARDRKGRDSEDQIYASLSILLGGFSVQRPKKCLQALTWIRCDLYKIA